MVDSYVRQVQGKWILGDGERPSDMNYEFLIHLSTASLDKRVLLHKDEKKYAELEGGTPCSYHSHDKNKPCEGKQT